MGPLHVESLSPFVPSGADYAAARRFFTELGFEELWENSGYAGFKNGNAQFILQQFDNREFAENFMITIIVPDLDRWWAAAEAKRLAEAFPGVRLNAPKEFPWGREVHFIDLAGVCWHVRQQG
jgi:catechol 2,3-dioxygenase-like lactoylglutathione lyase family enzyme